MKQMERERLHQIVGQHVCKLFISWCCFWFTANMNHYECWSFSFCWWCRFLKLAFTDFLSYQIWNLQCCESHVSYSCIFTDILRVTETAGDLITWCYCRLNLFTPCVRLKASDGQTDQWWPAELQLMWCYCTHTSQGHDQRRKRSGGPWTERFDQLNKLINSMMRCFCSSSTMITETQITCQDGLHSACAFSDVSGNNLT